MNISIPFSISQEEAVCRLKGYIKKKREQNPEQAQSISLEWRGTEAEFRFESSGVAIQGLLVVHHKTLEIQAKIPLILKPFQKKIETVLIEHISGLFA
jgi:hypothetical protein